MHRWWTTIDATRARQNTAKRDIRVQEGGGEIKKTRVEIDRRILTHDCRFFLLKADVKLPCPESEP
jgi:hypothetical protein